MNKSLILLDNEIQIFTLADFNTAIFIVIVLFDGGRVGTAFIDVDQNGLVTGSNRVFEKSACGLFVRLDSQ